MPDTTPPTSQVRVLPAASGENFVISWAGEDNEGIAGYDIYVSVNQGPFTKWLSNTPLTSAVYEALPGQTLAFYSVARDFAGNSEPATPPENAPVTSIPQRGGITGVLFHDRNADGLRQLNEDGLADWVVFLDTDEDRLPDADEVRATTDATGSYRFENLPAGDYQVVPITPAGWRAYERLTTTASNTTVQTAIATTPTGSSIWADLIGLTKLDADSGYAGLRGAGSVVAVLDTGFAADARSLISNLIVYQYDFVDNDTDAHDPNGHGTVVTQLISTVAPESSFIILRVLDASGRGTFATVERALQWLVVHGPSFGLTAVNLSFSDAAGYDLAASRHGLGDELAALANQGVVVVAAAGNNQYRTPGVAYPAADPSVLAVGAVWPGAVGPAAWQSGAKDHSTTADQIVSFSQRSKNISTIYAPGAALTLSSQDSLAGTSYAAPQVAGLAALANQAARQTLGRSLTPQEFRHLLQHTGPTLFDGDDEDDNVRNTLQFQRRIDIPATLAAVAKVDNVTAPREDGSISVPTDAAFDPLWVAKVSRPITVLSGETTAGVDFGFYQPAGLDLTLFDDRNRNGQRDAEEPLLGQVPFFLDFNANGARDDNEPTGKTDVNGVARLSDLTPGLYQLVINLPGVVLNPIEQVALVSGQSLAKDLGLRLAPLDVVIDRPASPISLPLGQSIELSATIRSGHAGTTLRYAWEIVEAPSGPPAELLTQEHQATFRPRTAGTYRVRLSVSDEYRQAASVEWTLTVLGNHVEPEPTPAPPVPESTPAPSLPMPMASPRPSPSVPFARPFRVTVTATGRGVQLNVHDNQTGLQTHKLHPFEATFDGPVHVVMADVTGDGTADLIVAAGAGGGPRVRIYDGVGLTALADFFGIPDPAFRGGAHLAVGDLDGDGIADLVVWAGAGGGPRITIWDTRQLLAGNLDQAIKADFFAYDASFRGGINVVLADVNGDGRLDLITGAGAGGGPHVKVFDIFTRELLASFFAFDPTFRGGVNVAFGDVNGDGRVDIITGAGAGGGPHVRVFDLQTMNILADFFAFEPTFTGGVHVASGDLDNDGLDDIVVGAGSGGGPHVRVYSGNQSPMADFFAFDSTNSAGAVVEVGSVPNGNHPVILIASEFDAGQMIRAFDVTLQDFVFQSYVNEVQGITIGKIGSRTRKPRRPGSKE